MEPLIKKESKANIAVLIPYRKTEKGYEYYLQKRDGNAPTNPNVFSMFGGSLEDDESGEEGMLREISEELEYRPTTYKYLGYVETLSRVCYVYIEEVGEDFESLVRVCEGEYGAFKAHSEVEFSKETSHIMRTVLYGVEKFLTQNN